MASEDEREDLEQTGYQSGQVRIVGAEPAGRSAARTDSDRARAGETDAEAGRPADDVGVPPLPHWTEPPTGEVPAVLSREEPEAGTDPYSALPGPTWREEGSDWEAQNDRYEPSMLAGDQTGQGSLDPGSDRQPWVFDIPVEGEGDNVLDDGGREDDQAWDRPAVARSRASTDNGPVTAVLPEVDQDQAPSGETPYELSGTGDDLDTGDGEGASEEPRSRLGLLRRSGRRPSRGDASRAAHRAGSAPSDGLGASASPPDEAPPRNMTAAIVSGVVLAALALIAFKVGPAAAVAFVTLVVAMAAAEAFAAFRRGGYQPLTLLGLVATVSLMVATYNKGLEALPLVFVVLVVACFVWHQAGVEHTDAVRSTGTTLFVFGWVGVFGSYAALLLAPSLFPERHGIAFLLGAVIAGVAYDVGALTFGAWLGRHPMAAVSPNKTWEGFVGGVITSLIVSVIIIHLIHPWTVPKAALLALVVSIVATLGDLFESTVKRHLGLKDMGRLLPGHGGMLDRVDGLLFALPATYYLVIAFHLG